MSRVYNFSAGPSMLPLSVLQKAAAEMTDYQGSGMSVMEMSHRSAVYEKIIADAEALVRSVLDVPDNYKVLFLQGGASTQFAAVPLNLMTKSGKADYVISGIVYEKAYEEAKRYGDVKVLASSADKNFTYIPAFNLKTCARMRIMSTFAITTRFLVQNSPRFRTRVRSLWWQTCLPVSYPSRLTFPALPWSMPVLRKTWARPD